MKTVLLSCSLNFLFRLTNKYQIPYFAVKCLDPLIIAGFLIISAADQKSRTVHCLDSLNSRIRVGSL